MADHLQMTRDAYDVVAEDYAKLLRDELAGKPFDRAMLAAFAELVAGGGAVVDAGCGPGRITAHLASLGVDVFGVDLSPAMVEVARRDHPGLRFTEGSMTEMDIADETLEGVVAWYSIIHTPPQQLPAVFTEFARVLRPGGHLLLALQTGDQRVRLEQAYGHAVSYDVYRLDPARIGELIADAGLSKTVELIREPVGFERTRQAYLMAQKPAEKSSDGRRSEGP